MTDTITVTRTFVAPRERVWAAFTRPEYFAVWFGTAAVDVPQESLFWIAETGNPWSAVMRLPDGSTKDWAGQFVAVETLEKLVFTMTDEPEDPDSATPVTIVLTDTEDGTLATVTQEVPGFTEEQQEAVIGGYRAFLDTLAKNVLDLDG